DGIRDWSVTGVQTCALPISRAEGQYLYDADGTRYLDVLGGFGMFNVGRNNARVRAALVETLELETPGSVQLGVSLLPGLLAEERSEERRVGEERRGEERGGQ